MCFIYLVFFCPIFSDTKEGAVGGGGEEGMKKKKKKNNKMNEKKKKFVCIYE